MALFIQTLILLLTLVSPFIAVYAVSFAKKGNYKKHIIIQKMLFLVCMAALVVLEIQIRLAGGSGSIAKNGTYYHTTFFKIILIAHIIGAVLTYIVWTLIFIISSFMHAKKGKLPGDFSKTHKLFGKITIFGLFYTAITALIVYMLTFVL
ncbi:MAG: DUF420 domain-containing protein [Brumimicrobium sp.]|nr:DUF420 domain-containing protein [Brumimicrobium sp.]MCO5267348.1 DUF420 domain-containing protein [Brumimicrobium sp.]